MKNTKPDVDSELRELIKELEGTESAMQVYLKKEQILKYLRRLKNG